MKSIKGLREQYELITEKEDKEQRKLTTLVRAGLFDAKKLPMLKRALEKSADKMTPAEKKILIDLLDSLMNQVVSNEPVYMKVKRNVQGMNEELIAEAPSTISDVPSIVVLKRKAVRVYPGGQQVGLYYSQQLDKYVTIPFGETGIAEETEMREVYNPRRDRDRYRDRDNDDFVDQNYTDLSANERRKLTPTNAARIAMNRTGSPVSAIGAAALSMYLKKKYGRKFSPDALQKTRKDARRLVRRALGRNPKGSITEQQQIDEALPALVPLAVAGGRVALGALARSTAGRAIGGALASGAKNVLSKGSKLWKRVKDKLKNKTKNPKNRRKGRRDYDLDLGFGGGGSMGGGNGASDQPQIKTPVTHSRVSDPNLVTKSGPTYAKDLPASLRAREYNLYTQSLQRENVEIDLGGNIFEINSKVADKFVNVYNSLNEANQEKMLNMMLNEETQSKVIEFVTRY